MFSTESAMHLCACMSSHSWFSSALARWYRSNRRPLPWRTDPSPYHVWLSEVILQQTRVDQGTAYWHRFVERWPTLADLAAATEGEVLKEWQGLGYYSRARNLRTAARQVMDLHHGRFPDDPDRLRALKGVGDYTAAAIASICFGHPEAVVDGNVYRVLARVFGIHTPIDSTQGRREFKDLATALLDHKHPGEHNQAVMELGALVCTPLRPRCEECPIEDRCVARASGTIAQLPVKQGRAKTRDRWFNYLHIPTVPGALTLQQRTAKDIWQGLYEPPLIESKGPLDEQAFAELLRDTLGPHWRLMGRWCAPRHVLSHQVIHATFWTVAPPSGYTMPPEWTAIAGDELERYAVPRLVERWLEEL